ncbi:MAG: hypothetical protein ACE5JG_05665 [Planctomycetota bacterium]
MIELLEALWGALSICILFPIWAAVLVGMTALFVLSRILLPPELRGWPYARTRR